MNEEEADTVGSPRPKYCAEATAPSPFFKRSLQRGLGFKPRLLRNSSIKEPHRQQIAPIQSSASRIVLGLSWKTSIAFAFAFAMSANTETSNGGGGAASQAGSPAVVAQSCRKKKTEVDEGFVKDLINHIDEFVSASYDEHKSCLQKTVRKLFGMNKAVESSASAPPVVSVLPLRVDTSSETQNA